MSFNNYESSAFKQFLLWRYTTDCVWFMFKFKGSSEFQKLFYATRKGTNLSGSAETSANSSLKLLSRSKIRFWFFRKKVRIQSSVKLIWKELKWKHLMSRKINLIRNITIIPWELFCFHLFPGKITDSFRQNVTKIRLNGGQLQLAVVCFRQLQLEGGRENIYFYTEINQTKSEINTKLEGGNWFVVGFDGFYLRIWSFFMNKFFDIKLLLWTTVRSVEQFSLSKIFLIQNPPTNSLKQKQKHSDKLVCL